VNVPSNAPVELNSVTVLPGAVSLPLFVTHRLPEASMAMPYGPVPTVNVLRRAPLGLNFETVLPIRAPFPPWFATHMLPEASIQMPRGLLPTVNVPSRTPLELNSVTVLLGFEALP